MHKDYNSFLFISTRPGTAAQDPDNYSKPQRINQAQ